MGVVSTQLAQVFEASVMVVQPVPGQLVTVLVRSRLNTKVPLSPGEPPVMVPGGCVGIRVGLCENGRRRRGSVRISETVQQRLSDIAVLVERLADLLVYRVSHRGIVDGLNLADVTVSCWILHPAVVGETEGQQGGALLLAVRGDQALKSVGTLVKSPYFGCIRSRVDRKRLTNPGWLATSGGPAGGSEVGNLAECAVL